MLQKPHFFKAYSSIGILYPPYNYNPKGVYCAPDYILTENFLKDFPKSKLDTYHFATKENFFTKTYTADLVFHLTSFAKCITNKLKRNETQVVVGGDNCISFACVLSLLSNYKPSEIGYVQFDSHGELNSYSHSPSKNFHGMYLRPFLDTFDIKAIDILVPTKLKSKQILFFGDQTLDTEEKEFIKRNSIKSFSSENFKHNQEETLLYVKSFIKNFKHIHLNIDIDVFRRSFAPATGYPSKQGYIFSEIKKILNVLKKAHNISIDLTEINSSQYGSKKTIELGQKVLRHLLF